MVKNSKKKSTPVNEAAKKSAREIFLQKRANEAFSTLRHKGSVTIMPAQVQKVSLESSGRTIQHLSFKETSTVKPSVEPKIHEVLALLDGLSISSIEFIFQTALQAVKDHIPINLKYSLDELQESHKKKVLDFIEKNG